MAGYLSTHILDTARGIPAEGVKIELYKLSQGGNALIRTLVSNADGRTDEQVVPQEEFAFGSYQFLFHVGAYLRRTEAYEEETGFLDIIQIRFNMTKAIHYHVPLLLAPYSYSTYLGS